MEIKLNKNGWYCRLQRYVFGNPPEFYNFCPMFWLTNFCILVVFIIPVVPLVKTLYVIAKWLEKGFDKVATWLENSICMPVFEAKSSRMSIEDVFNAWFFNTENSLEDNYKQDIRNELNFWIYDTNDINTHIKYKRKEQYIKQFDAWKKTTPNWEKILNDYKDKRKSIYEEYLKNKDKIEAERETTRLKVIKDEAQAKIRKVNTYNAIIKYTKWIGYIVATAIVLFCAYWVFIFVRFVTIYTIEHFYLDKFITILKNMGLIILGLGILFGIVYFLVKLISKIPCNICICDSKFSKFMETICSSILIGILWTARKTGGFFSFFWTYIVAVKKDYCPGISWMQEEEK